MSDYCFSDSDQYTSDDTISSTDWYQSLSDLEEDKADKTNSTQSIPAACRVGKSNSRQWGADQHWRMQ